MFSVFLSSCRNTRESLGELEEAVEILALPNFHSRFYLTNKEASTVLCSVVKHAGSG